MKLQFGWEWEQLKSSISQKVREKVTWEVKINLEKGKTVKQKICIRDTQLQ